ncbi:molybdate ABC transporter substrate-binding protein [Leptospira sp. FAT2]|uniref:molybdate ABC transporter substrate-binding protein n=1 Tax=Leptospira sanjuanensis TaxID=2879643 RepID=UPI001EE92F49|nr:molybdate ABC transporter substrate-binding protein [Leptospira sanjuanensis]MCG6192899.1 molybdate ABC transporter substrate-binding protein [Leptospira sanjuanensis]
MNGIKIPAFLVFVLQLSPIFGEEKVLLVSAASSLTQVFTSIGKEFEKKEGIKVSFNFAASGVLLQQIENGAPADVFASADQENVDKGLVKNLFDPATRKNFVSNSLVLIAPIDSKLNLKKVSDLRNETVRKISFGNPAIVPAGKYAKEVLEQEGWDAALEKKWIPGENVRQVLDYVSRGEVDAGFVYRTDAVLFQDRVKVAVANLKTKPILYPAIVVAKSSNGNEAKRFVEFLTSKEAKKIFQKYRFGKP